MVHDPHDPRAAARCARPRARRPHALPLSVTLAPFLAGVTLLPATPVPAQTTIRVSVASDGTEADGGSWVGIVSADGRYVLFESTATNLVPNDTNGIPGEVSGWDIFIHDLVTRQTERVNVASDGSESENAEADPIAISANGRYILLSSAASNLVPNDTNGTWDSFVRDRQTGTTERVNVAPDGTQTENVMGARSMSADGRYLAFGVIGPDLIPGTDGQWGTIIRDRQTRQDEFLLGAWGPRLSADGRYVAFIAGRENSRITTGQVYRYDRQTKTMTRASLSHNGGQVEDIRDSPIISADGNVVSFHTEWPFVVTNDTNGIDDVFVRDLRAGLTERVSVASGGGQAVNPCCLGSRGGQMSASGRYVTFESTAGNLVPDDTNVKSDIFVHDRETNQTERISVAHDGSQGDGSSEGNFFGLSADGRVVVFASEATNLVPNDTNGSLDVFVRIRWVPGDVDGNGQVTVDDARMLMRFAAGLENALGDHVTRGDMDGDKALTLSDAARLIRAM